MNTTTATVTKRSLKSHGTVKDRAFATGTMHAMKTLLQELLRLGPWPLVYVLSVLFALGIAPDARAGDDRHYEIDLLTDTAAEINLDEPRWAYTRSVRVQLAKGDNLRLETTIPLDHSEQPRLTLGLAKKVSREWSVDLSLWAAL